MPKVDLILLRGLAAARPAAADVIPGTLYYSTDTVTTDQSTGVVWVTYADAGGSGITELTGPVTAGPGSGSQAATIINNAITTGKILDANVTLAKIENIATDSILGRATAAAGVPEVLTALPFAFTGDVTRAADSNAQTIANSAVTLAKIANASANSVLVGAGAAGSGAAYTQITLGSGVTMTGTVLSATGSGGTGNVSAAGTLASGEPVLGAGSTSVASGPINLAGGSAHVAGDLPFANLAQLSALSIAANATNSTADVAGTALSDGQTLKRVGTALTSARFGPQSTTVLTNGTAATYTVPAGIYRIRVRVQGGGGSGGGSDGTSGGIGAGGGAGAYAEKVYTVVPAQSCTYTVSSTGATGVTGNATGNTGATASFTDGVTAVTCTGGVGGGSMATGSTLAGAGGGAGGSASNGDVNITGGQGQTAARWSATSFSFGMGAASILGGGGASGLNGTGGAGQGFGSGGGGTASSNTVADQTSGAGAPGVIIVEEYN